ncbi:MAG TPA: glycosyltransferase family 39 protein [Blastocatellia bacterium]|nr:glycosyltransferase family 39 protein [Blastocatellia bacterium]
MGKTIREPDGEASVAAALDRLRRKLAPGADSEVPVRRKLVKTATWCVVIFIVALGVRLLYWQDSRTESLYGESIITYLIEPYQKEVANMIEERGILFPGVQVDPGDAHRIWHPPGYSMLLLAIYGDNPPDRRYASLRLVQIFGDSVSALLIFLIAAELFPPGVGIIAGLLTAFSPHLAYYAVWLTPDSISVLPILLAVYLIIIASKRPRFALMMGAGALLGASCWLRSNSLLLAPLLALTVPLLFERGKRLRYGLGLVGATALLIAPITLRNWVVYHRFIPLTIATGINLVEGLAEYDSDNSLGMPLMDSDVVRKDVEWNGRPDYEAGLWAPDGIDRDRTRFGKGLEVIRAHPRWFLGVMFKRMAFMMRYNDFDPNTRAFYNASAPVVAAGPPFGHQVEIPSGTTPAWSSSATDLLAGGTLGTSEAQAALTDDGLKLEITGDNSASNDQFASAPVRVQRRTDYLFTVRVERTQGSMMVKVKGPDARITLAAMSVPRAHPKKSRKISDRSRIPAMSIPFSSCEQDTVRLVVSNDGQSMAQSGVRVGQAELRELGPTPSAWMHWPRSVVRGIQKNVFKTRVMRPLILAGIILLALARRRRALVILLAVPVYYLCIHAAFSTEYRYIVAIHYFLFVFVAASSFWAWAALREASHLAYAWLMRRFPRTAPDQA